MKLELGFGTKCGALLIWSLVSCSLLAAEADQTWRLGWSNDGYLGSDNQFTNGVSLQINSARTAHLEQTRGTPVIGKSLANWLLPHRDDLVYRES
ncbi:MAG: lipid A-modifier LpxR family protein, partial [Wenzhouxiangella sp.]